jgi:hypothetical protein
VGGRAVLCFAGQSGSTKKLVPIQCLALASLESVVCRKLTSMLVNCGLDVPHCILRHKPTATASEEAKAVHFPGPCTLKAVVVKLDGSFALCAIPSTHSVDLDALAELTDAKGARLAEAAELRERVPAAQVRLLYTQGPLHYRSVYSATCFFFCCMLCG